MLALALERTCDANPCACILRFTVPGLPKRAADGGGGTADGPSSSRRSASSLAIVCTVLAAITFIALNEAFEGPSVTDPIAGEPYELTATFNDTEALPTKQPVLVRGVQVGKVTDVDFDHDDLDGDRHVHGRRRARGASTTTPR